MLVHRILHAHDEKNHDWCYPLWIPFLHEAVPDKAGPGEIQGYHIYSRQQQRVRFPVGNNLFDLP